MNDRDIFPNYRNVTVVDAITNIVTVVAAITEMDYHKTWICLRLS